jgi:hypothetical protein
VHPCTCASCVCVCERERERVCDQCVGETVHPCTCAVSIVSSRHYQQSPLVQRSAPASSSPGTLAPTPDTEQASGKDSTGNTCVFGRGNGCDLSQLGCDMARGVTGLTLAPALLARHVRRLGGVCILVFWRPARRFLTLALHLEADGQADAD